MADLSQFRGKRALVIGLPHTAQWRAWAEGVTKAMTSLGVVNEVSLDGNPSHEQVRVMAAACDAACVMVTGRFKMRQAHAAGIPVLRVRRDGSVEVDNATP